MPIPSLPQLPGEAASTGHKASGLLLTRLTRPRPPPGCSEDDPAARQSLGRSRPPERAGGPTGTRREKDRVRRANKPGSFSSCENRHVEDVEVPAAVEDRCAGTPCQSQRWMIFSHKGSGLHRGFWLSCGMRGKHGQGEWKLKPDFQNSSIAQPGFRKQVQELNSVGSVVSDGFPLFRTQLRGLLSFSII